MGIRMGREVKNGNYIKARRWLSYGIDAPFLYRSGKYNECFTVTTKRLQWSLVFLRIGFYV